jgi:hypothetical protein
MDAGEYGALAKEAKTSSSKKDLGDIEKPILAGFTKNRSNIKKAKAPRLAQKGMLRK